MIAYLQARAKTWKRWQQMLSRQKWLSLRRNCSASRSETGFFSCGMVFVCATAFHGAMILVCETKTRFLMPTEQLPQNNMAGWLGRPRPGCCAKTGPSGCSRVSLGLTGCWWGGEGCAWFVPPPRLCRSKGAKHPSPGAVGMLRPSRHSYLTGNYSAVGAGHLNLQAHVPGT